MTIASDSTVKEQTPRDQYTATAGQTDFTYNFIIFDADHLTVQRTRDGSTTTLSRGGGADYTVTNVGEEDGGDVVLNSGANADDVITIERTVPYERVTDFSQSGDYRSDDVNTEEDKQVMMLQQLVRDLDRALTLKSETQIDSIELPSPEAGEAIGWNTDEDGIVNLSLPDGTSIQEFLKIKFSDQNDDGDQYSIEEDSTSGDLHIQHPDWNTDLIFKQGGGIAFPDTDNDGNVYEIKENSNGHLVISHPDLNTDYILKQDGSFVLPDTDGDGNAYSLKENSNGHLDIIHSDLSNPFRIKTDNTVLLPDGMDVGAHGAEHHDGGDQEIDVADLSGEDGTDGQVIQSDGSAASWVSAGQLVLIETQNPSGVSSVDFTTGIDSTFRVYVFYVSGYQPSSDATNMLFRHDEGGGGSNFESSSGDYRYTLHGNDVDGSSQSNNSSGGTEIRLNSTALGNNTNEEKSSLTLVVYAPADANTATKYTWEAAIKDENNDLEIINGAGQGASITAVDAFQFLQSNGNIASGEISLYGIRS